MYKYTDIENVLSGMKTVDVKGKDYRDVACRVSAFRSICVGGRIETEILYLSDGVVTMKATVYNEEGQILATGFAQEKESSSYINKTSYIENCETSAVGRALGFAGFGSASICSLDELVNAVNGQIKAQDEPKAVKPSNDTAKAQTPQETPKSTPTEDERAKAMAEMLTTFKAFNYTAEQVAVIIGENFAPKTRASELTTDEIKKLTKILKGN